METFLDWLLPVLSSLIIVIIGYFLSTRKQKADIVMQMAEAARNLIEPLNKRIEELERMVKAQDKELFLLRPLPAIVATMSRGVHILIDQLRRNNIVPDWTPVDMPPVNPRKNGRIR